MTYQATTAALATASATTVVAAYEAVPPATFVLTAARLLARFNLRAVALADLSLASVLDALPLGLTRPEGDADRLEKSFTTLVERIREDPPEIAVAKVERISRAEPLDAGREAYLEAMVEREVIGWTRKTDADPCELCASLADGTVLEPSHPMYDHPGCNCQPVPVLEGAAA